MQRNRRLCRIDPIPDYTLVPDQAVAAGVVVALVYVYVIKFYWTVFTLRHIKGPLPIAILGNLYDPRCLSVRPSATPTPTNFLASRLKSDVPMVLTL